MDFLGTGMIIDFLKHSGTLQILRDQLKMSVKTVERWLAQ